MISFIDLVGLSADDAKAELLAGIPPERVKPEHEPTFPGQAAASAEWPPEPRFPGSLPPVWNVPHDRNPNFTGRSELLSGLYDSLHAGQATVLRQALRGLGGVGKTQLVLEYVYQYAEEYSMVWWVQSETDPATNYAELTRELSLPTANISESEIRVRAVKRWLEQHEGWLLVFDNATEPDAIRHYLPQGQAGHVIITSRYWDWGEVANGLGVEVFDRDTESVPFLLRRTSQADEAAAQRLADELGNLPLALAQAAAYIAGTGITLDEYLELYQESPTEMWQDEKAPLGYPEPVSKTWTLAMEKMAAEPPAAAELLRLLAYLAPEPVARELLEAGAEHLPETLRGMVENRRAWNRCLAAFRRYGLVEVMGAGLVVHRLVQAVTRDRLSEVERQSWAAAAVQMLESTYPEDAYNPQDIRTWVICTELMLHVQIATDHAEALGVATKATRTVLCRVAQYLHAQIRYDEAEQLFQRVIEIGEHALGNDHPDIASYLNNLAELYRHQARYDEAQPLFQRAIEIGGAVLDNNHPDIVEYHNNLALLYQSQGRYDEAEPLFQRALRVGEESLGSGHADIARRLNNLALLYQSQGRYDEAEPLFQRALRVGEEVLNSDHPSIANYLNNLALLYRIQERYEEAKPLYIRALHISETTLGADHPNIAYYLNNLATLYRFQGRYEEAEPLYNRALRIDENVFGPDHPEVAIDLSNLAGLYLYQKRYTEAESFFQRALQISEQALGTGNPTVAIRMNNLANFYRDQGRYDEAETLYQRALAIAEATFGIDHPNTNAIRSNYDRLLQQRASP